MNLPNKLSLFRLLLVPIILLILYSNISYNVDIATAIFILASVTDLIDGYIARSRNIITNLGKFLDPLVDKVLVVSILIYLVYKQIIPDWMAIIIVAREFMVSGLRILSASHGIVIAASKLGKLKTNSQIVAVIFAMQEWPFYWWLMFIAVILTIVSGAHYIWKGRHLFKE